MIQEKSLINKGFFCSALCASYLLSYPVHAPDLIQAGGVRHFDIVGAPVHAIDDEVQPIAHLVAGQARGEHAVLMISPRSPSSRKLGSACAEMDQRPTSTSVASPAPA
jgi:hypothetical protein